MGELRHILKMSNFQLSRSHDLDLDLGLGHTAYCCALLIDLYLQAKFHSNRENFLRTEGRTYGHRETGFIRSTATGVDLKISPVQVDGRFLIRAVFFQVESHVTLKLGQISKIRPEQI